MRFSSWNTVCRLRSAVYSLREQTHSNWSYSVSNELSAPATNNDSLRGVEDMEAARVWLQERNIQDI